MQPSGNNQKEQIISVQFCFYFFWKQPVEIFKDIFAVFKAMRCIIRKFGL